MQLQEFENLYNQYYKGILGYFIKNFNRDYSLAEDLTQDTFAKILRHLNCHNGFSYSKQYIYKVAQNIKYDYIRRDKGLPTIDIDNAYVSLLTESPIIDNFSEYNISLQPADKALFALLSEGYNSFELAKIYNITPSAVRARIAKLKQAIRKSNLRNLEK